VVNDGSTTRTLEVIAGAYSLEPFPRPRARLKTQPVRAIYQSRIEPRLRVIDKETGAGAMPSTPGQHRPLPWVCGWMPIRSCSGTV